MVFCLPTIKGQPMNDDDTDIWVGIGVGIMIGWASAMVVALVVAYL